MINILDINNYIDLKNTLNKEDIVISAIQDENNELKVISKYSDNVWDYSHKVGQKSKSKGCKIFFEKFAFKTGKKLTDKPELLEIIKDCAYKMQSNGLKTNTIILNTKALFKFIDYMSSELNINSPSDMTVEQINNYIDYFLENNKGKSITHINSAIYVVKNTLYKYRTEINNGIHFLPFDGINLSNKLKRTGKSKPVKQTEIIPDHTWQDISQTCEGYLDNYLNNIENENTINHLFVEALYQSKNAANSFSSKYLKDKSECFKKYKNSTAHFNLLNKTQIAAAIIIQAYTGMRVSELYSLKTNCISTEEVVLGNETYSIKKINGLTFKYQESKGLTEEEGKKAAWLCPPVVEKAVIVLTNISDKTRAVYKHHLEHNNNIEFHSAYLENMDSLFLRTAMRRVDRVEINRIDAKYKTFLQEEGVDIDFKLSSHCFRRTIARFFARTLIDIPVNALKEQFKHYSANITEYYMREDETTDSSFIELMEGYSKAKEEGNKGSEKLLFKEMQNKFDSAITTANNVEELLAIVNGKQVKIVNEYIAQLDSDNGVLNPLESLSCNGIIILPDLHIDYWKEMLTLYEELVLIEPDSIWYKNEKNLIEDVLNKLSKNEAYIATENK